MQIPQSFLCPVCLSASVFRYDEAMEIFQNKPKKPMTSYFLWLDSVREDKRAERPDMSVPEFAKWTGQLWRDMTDEERNSWKQKGDELAADYAKAMTEWVNAATVVELASHARSDLGPAKATYYHKKTYQIQTGKEESCVIPSIKKKQPVEDAATESLAELAEAFEAIPDQSEEWSDGVTVIKNADETETTAHNEADNAAADQNDETEQVDTAQKDHSEEEEERSDHDDDLDDMQMPMEEADPATTINFTDSLVDIKLEIPPVESEPTRIFNEDCFKITEEDLALRDCPSLASATAFR